jgi:hypothetical protein
MRIWLQPGDEELCELERTAEELGLDLLDLVRSVSFGEPRFLDEDEWAEMDNADSSSSRLTREGAIALSVGYGRDFEGIERALKASEPIPMPLVLETRGALYLVGGNTRLMACRVLGIQPQIWVFQYRGGVDGAANE